MFYCVSGHHPLIFYCVLLSLNLTYEKQRLKSGYQVIWHSKRADIEFQANVFISMLAIFYKNVSHFNHDESTTFIWWMFETYARTSWNDTWNNELSYKFWYTLFVTIYITCNLIHENLNLIRNTKDFCLF